MAKAKWTKTNYPSIYKYAVKNGHKYGIRIRYQDNNLNWKEKSESGFLTIKAARKRKSELEETINKDLATTFDGDKITFKKWFDQYLELMTPTWSLDSLQNVIVLYRNHLNHFDNMVLSKITLAKYQTFINEKIKSGLAISTVKELHRKMMAIVNSAVTHEIINRNKLKNVIIKTDIQISDKTKNIEKDLVNKLDHFASQHLNDLDYAMYVLLKIGWRRSEIMGLRVGAINIIDVDRIELSVKTTRTRQDPEGTPKNPSSCRVSQLTGDYAEAIISALKSSEKSYGKNNKLFDENSLIFVSCTARARGINYLTYLTKRLSKEVGVHLTPHMFRHTFATQALANGMNLVEVSKWLGHSRVDTTLNIYSHTSSESRENLINFANS